MSTSSCVSMFFTQPNRATHAEKMLERLDVKEESAFASQMDHFIVGRTSDSTGGWFVCAAIRVIWLRTGFGRFPLVFLRCHAQKCPQRSNSLIHHPFKEGISGVNTIGNAVHLVARCLSYRWSPDPNKANYG